MYWYKKILSLEVFMKEIDLEVTSEGILTSQNELNTKSKK